MRAAASLAAPPPDPALARGPMPARVGNVRIGTASWTEKTLLASHTFYPPGVSSAEDRLRYYARHFPTVEVDASFYSLPTLAMAEGWVARTPEDFTFGVKAFAAMTQHPFGPARLPADLRSLLPGEARGEATVYPRSVPPSVLDAIWLRFRAALLPLHASGKLAYVLMQMPRWFLPSAASDRFLEAIPSRLPGYAIAVEFRAAPWLEERRRARTLDLLARHELVYTCVDEPQGTPASVPPIAEVTSPRLALVRFHGRRTDVWVKPGATTSERFGYLYGAGELREWLPRVRSLASEVHEVQVMMNNCYRESAVHNAKDLAELLVADRDQSGA